MEAVLGLSLSHRAQLLDAMECLGMCCLDQATPRQAMLAVWKSPLAPVENPSAPPPGFWVVIVLRLLA
jgi:hypothetical protein